LEEKNYFNKIKKFMSGFVTQIIGPVIDVEFPKENYQQFIML
jgi:hypothetical protein